MRRLTILLFLLATLIAQAGQTVITFGGHTTGGRDPFFGWDQSGSWGSIYILCGADGTIAL